MSVGIPFEEQTVQTYLCDFLDQTSQGSVTSEFGLEPFSILTISKQRTFVEKLGATVKFAFLDESDGDATLRRLTAEIRHLYDLHMLLQQPDIRHFILDGARFNHQDFNAFWQQVLMYDLQGNKEKKGPNSAPSPPLKSGVRSSNATSTFSASRTRPSQRRSRSCSSNSSAAISMTLVNSRTGHPLIHSRTPCQTA